MLISTSGLNIWSKNRTDRLNEKISTSQTPKPDYTQEDFTYCDYQRCCRLPRDLSTSAVDRRTTHEWQKNLWIEISHQIRTAKTITSWQ